MSSGLLWLICNTKKCVYRYMLTSIIPGDGKFLTVKLLPNVAIDYWSRVLCILKVTGSYLTPGTGYSYWLPGVSLILFFLPYSFQLKFFAPSCQRTVHNLRNQELRKLNQELRMFSLFSFFPLPLFHTVYATSFFFLFLFLAAVFL